MSARVSCGNCGGRIDLPAGFAKAKVRCPDCGYYADVPAGQRAAAPPADPPRTASPPRPKDGGDEPRRSPEPPPAKPVARAKRAVDPRDHRPQFESDTPAGKPLLEGTQDFDDDKPYAVPGTGTKPCPHCRGQLPLDATRCVHCGRDLATGERANRNFQPIDRTWEEGWPFMLRVQVFAGAQVVNVLAAVVALASAESVGFIDLVTHAMFFLVNSSLQAFILGTYDTLTVRRTEKGSATLTRARRVGFFPLPPEKMKWKGSHAVGTVATHEVGLFTWMVCGYLLLLCVMPGAIFYWMVIRPEKSNVILCDEYGGTDDTIFRAGSREQAVEAAGVIAEATGLRHRKVL